MGQFQCGEGACARTRARHAIAPHNLLALRACYAQHARGWANWVVRPAGKWGYARGYDLTTHMRVRIGADVEVDIEGASSCGAESARLL